MSKRLRPCHSNFRLTFSGARLLRGKRRRESLSNWCVFSFLFFCFLFILFSHPQVERLSIDTEKTAAAVAVQSDDASRPTQVR